MKRFHVHVSVDNLDASIQFYSIVFGASPTVVKPDYAKWMVDDPRINFGISKRGGATGIDHLGIQVESDDQLTALREQVTGAQIAALDQPDSTCCYEPLRQILDDRSAGYRLGNFSHPRINSGLRRRQPIAEECLLRCCAKRRSLA